jgi:CheY-like chemotaxis protein
MMVDRQNILVIDDDGDSGELVPSVALAMGLQCPVTIDPTTFLEKLVPDITLILFDLVMPEMDDIRSVALIAGSADPTDSRPISSHWSSLMPTLLSSSPSFYGGSEI